MKSLGLLKRLLVAVLGALTIAMVALVTEDVDWLAGVGIAALGVSTVGVLEVMRRVRRAPRHPPALAVKDLETASGLMTLLPWPLVIPFAAYAESGWESVVGAAASCVAALCWLAAAMKLRDALSHLCPECGKFWDPAEDTVYLRSLCPDFARDPEKLNRAWGFPSS